MQLDVILPKTLKIHKIWVKN